MIVALAEKNRNLIHLIFRIFVGLLFCQHGAMKLFGWFTPSHQHMPYLGLMGVAGVIEFFGGLSIAAGFFTRYIAAIAGAEMIFAFFMVHFPRGWVPIETGGELPLLYFASFIMLALSGGGRWSLDRLIGLEPERGGPSQA